MSGKYIFILFLLALLVFTVYNMMKFETHIREERQVKLYIEDESKPLLSKIPDEELMVAAESSDYYFTAGGDYFKGLQVHYGEDEKIMVWEDIYLKGVNLGVAIPGKFPAEFSLAFEDYLDWIRMIGEMNANIIRIYTILPPGFYEALAYYNLHHYDRPVYLMQGVWAEVPGNENYYDAEFVHDFEKEMIDAIDVMHGNAMLREKPGKASGVYSSDISRYVVAILLGREWEPGSVFKTNRVNKIDRYNGDFVSMNDGNAMEAWLAKMMDFAVLYETQVYRFQHPVSFVNWLPLDPMYHNTEIIENNRVREYDNDLESIDFMRFQATELFYPGIFAAYHVYPYYPDFIYLQDSYARPDAPDGSKGAYFNYLEDLKRHNPGMPLVIAEYGLPSSRGNSHFSPSGFHQGGHSEAAQARLSLELTRNITDAGCAGAIYFEWIDEWFKHNWLVMDFELPEDDRKLWHNMENPEQNFGIMALEDKIKTIDGELSEWDLETSSGKQISLYVDADASYFYLASILPGYDPDKHNLYFAIDTYDSEKGDHRLPFTDEIFSNGFEFLVDIKSTDSAHILVDEPYSVFTDIYNNFIPVYASKSNNNGSFTRQYMLTNRSRTSLTGEKTDSVIIDRSRLQYGKSSNPESSNADWYYNEEAGTMEIRIDWHLLNVCNPAKQFVLDDKEETREIEYTKTEGFHIYAFLTDKNNNLPARYPAGDPLTCTWEGWSTPVYTERLKPVYYSLRDYFKGLVVEPGKTGAALSATESFRITDFYNNKAGAISVSFDNASYSQYEFALPVLQKYGLSASFGIIPGILENVPRNVELETDALMKRLSIKEVKEIAIDHEIAHQVLQGETIDDTKLFDLGNKTETDVQVVHGGGQVLSPAGTRTLIFSRKSPSEKVFTASFNETRYTVVGGGFSQAELDQIISLQENKWTIFLYHHLYENPAEIPHKLDKEQASRLFIQKSLFEQQIRLFRNSNYWIAAESDVFKYIKEKQASEVRTERYQNMIFLKAFNTLDPNKFEMPLTVEFTSQAKIIRLEGSEADGTYSNKNGTFHFNVMPNREVIIQIIE